MEEPDHSKGRRFKRAELADSGWHVAILAAIIAFLESSSFRSSGFFYVQLMDDFRVDREIASWPVSILGTAIDVGGVLAGLLSQRFSIFQVIVMSGVIASAGMMASALSPNIIWMTITLGLIHGIGSGSLYTMLQITLSMHYNKYRGTAHGIMYVGSTLSSLVFPMLLYLVRGIYGFRSSLLFLGAVLLHTIPISFFLKEPEVRRRRELQMTGRDGDFETATYEPEPGKSSSDASTEQPKNVPGGTSLFRSVASLLRCPMYYVIIVSWLVLCYNYDVFMTTVVDFAVDQGAADAQAVSLVSYCALTDIMGRILLPLISDMKYMRRSTLVACNYLLMGVAVLGLSQVASYTILWTVALTVACFMGCALTMHGVLLADYIGIEKLPVCYGLAGALCFPILLCKSSFLGAYGKIRFIGRDEHCYRLPTRPQQ